MAKKISIKDYNKNKANKNSSLILICIIIGLGIIAISLLFLYRNSEKRQQKYKHCIDNAVKKLNKSHINYYSIDGGKVYEGYPPADVEETNRIITEVIVDLNKCKKEE